MLARSHEATTLSHSLQIPPFLPKLLQQGTCSPNSLCVRFYASPLFTASDAERRPTSYWGCKANKAEATHWKAKSFPLRKIGLKSSPILVINVLLGHYP